MIYEVLSLGHITKGMSVDREEESTKDLVLWLHSVEKKRNMQSSLKGNVEVNKN